MVVRNTPLGIRIPLPNALIAVDIPASVGSHIRRSLTSACDVHEVVDAAGAAALLKQLTDVCLLVRIPGDAERTALPDFIILRNEYPNVPVVALFENGISSYKATLKLGAAGINEIVSTTPSLGDMEIRLALSRCHADGVAVRIWKRADPQIPDALIPVVKAALRLAHEPVALHKLAASTGMHERTLRKYCEHKGFPSPQWIIGWARLLVAGFYLEEPGRTIAAVAELLGYPSACALRNQIRRYAGLSPRIARGQNMTTMLARAFEACVRGDNPGDHQFVDRPRLTLVKSR